MLLRDLAGNFQDQYRRLFLLRSAKSQVGHWACSVLQLQLRVYDDGAACRQCSDKPTSQAARDEINFARLNHK